MSLRNDLKNDIKKYKWGNEYAQDVEYFKSAIIAFPSDDVEEIAKFKSDINKLLIDIMTDMYGVTHTDSVNEMQKIFETVVMETGKTNYDKAIKDFTLYLRILNANVLIRKTNNDNVTFGRYNGIHTKIKHGELTDIKIEEI